MTRDYVTIVSGLPRSGTSMMMQVLEAGGIPALTDGLRSADDSNPKGYYEFEPVKKTKEDPSWVDRARGMAVKMVYRLLYDLPGEYEYRVVFMRRDVEEVLISQQTMLQELGKKGAGASNERMAALFRRELASFEAWVARRENFGILYVEHGDMIRSPAGEAVRISRFLGGDLNTEAMAAAVDPSLYRARR